MQIGNDKTPAGLKHIFLTRKYFVLFCANKYVNLEIFSGKYSLSKLTPVETKSLKD